jgi:hypothetical protein
MAALHLVKVMQVQILPLMPSFVSCAAYGVQHVVQPGRRKPGLFDRLDLNRYTDVY